MNDEPTNGGNGEAGPRDPSNLPWFPIILIALGVLLLLRQVSGFSLQNWWALFILIPVFSAFSGAYRLWQMGGRLTFGVWTAFYGGLFPLLVALIFLFNLDWGDYWPAFIIVGGLGIMVGSFSPDSKNNTPRALLSHRPWGFFFGLSGTLLGITFLAFNLDWITAFPFFDVENWWGYFIILASLGGLFTAILLFARGKMLLALFNLGAAFLVAFTGFAAVYKLDWNLFNTAFPLLLILGGLWMVFGRGREEDQ